ncbi:transmembrane protein 243-like [Corticium candelabrum]|uniref:transmembrane protein 243-like n=1 Tax=Corticium candelabrum TaxID=121492 RepID=UPI002E2681A0|nr:transmembrane protein 243-like [Corticium candelabrum]
MASSVPLIRTSNDMNKPLFEEDSNRTKFVYITIALVTAAMVLFTFISAFTLAKNELNVRNVYFAFVLLLVVIPLVVSYWYNQGTLDPKFKIFIYYNCFTTVLLCISGNLYFHEV